MSCLFYLPRDRYTTPVRLRVEALLMEAFAGSSIDYTVRVSESVLARVHFVIRVPTGQGIPDVDVAALEAAVASAARSWQDEFNSALVARVGEGPATTLLRAYAHAFPEAYKEAFGPGRGVNDAVVIDQLSSGELSLEIYQPPNGDRRELRLKVTRIGPAMSLSRVLPILQAMGVDVVDEYPYEVSRALREPAWILDFGMLLPDREIPGRSTLPERFEEAFAAAWNERCGVDGFNALIVRGGMRWRQALILRAYARYMRQIGSSFSQKYIEDVVIANVGITRLLVSLFETRFAPGEVAGRADAEARLIAEIEEALNEVASLDQDRIMRTFLALITATLRTNFFQVDDDGIDRSSIAVKLDPRAVPDLPLPKPQFEIWVYSPQIEGVHLRFGSVARGGLRWSDRQEDFRTEVLGLVKAQEVKNAVIVPVGAKGGFYAKQLPDPSIDREAWLAEGKSAYREFIMSMLDITDNLVDGAIVPPRDVVRHDGDDPYLVVAADKGTATFSDIANGVAQSYGFWLDDAFASGGSAGYDHKAMGITARGAWESVKRHFREMGVNTQASDFTVVGVGDMSGDVFGNGMLLSEHIRLIAAFDHRHIFIDPDPDAARSFAERARLFELPRSSWADYDTGLISEGGGIFARSLKSVPVSPQMVTALGLKAGTTSMTPAELMKAILLAPVDLLWNGGIGTYIKASTEDNLSVGDRANDAIRVDGNQLRCKVIGEGGNLGASQLGRIEAAFAGVRVNTDAIDNSAGVDTSDHEVNIKILLGEVVRAGGLDIEARNELLASMTDEVAAHVLRDNYEQNVLLGNARAQEHSMVTVHERLIRWLEERGDLDRGLEFLPTDAEMEKRNHDGLGLKSPEFSVLVAYAKLALKEDILASSIPDDPYFEQTLADYFPAAIRQGYAGELENHPLRREIITNSIVNSMVNRGGITFAFRAHEETGATPEQVTRAFVVAREVFGLADYVGRIEALDNEVATASQTKLYLEIRRLLDRVVRWFLSARPSTLDIGAEIDRFAGVVKSLAPQVPNLLRGEEKKRLDRRAAELEKSGVPADLALLAASLLDQYSLLDIADIATDAGLEPAALAPVYYHVSERFGIDTMLTKVTRLPREDRWDALARGALRDDLYAVLESLTRSVIEANADNPAATPAKQFDIWAQSNEDSIQRAVTSLAAIRRLENPNIAALSVALRTLRSVIRSGSSSSA